MGFFGLVALSLFIAALSVAAPFLFLLLVPVLPRPLPGFPFIAVMLAPSILWLAALMRGISLFGLRTLWLILEAPIVAFWLIFITGCEFHRYSCP